MKKIKVPRFSPGDRWPPEAEKANEFSEAIEQIGEKLDQILEKLCELEELEG